MKTYSLQLQDYFNQSITTTFNGNSIYLEFRTFRKMMYLTCSINNSLVCAGVRCVPNVNLLPKWATEFIGGKLYFATLGNEYPSHDNIGGSVKLALATI